MQVKEKERITIARMIHDDLAQLLSALKIELTAMKGNAEKLDFLTQDGFDSVLLLVEQSIVSMKSILTDLRPVILDRMGLFPALKLLFSDFQKYANIPCDLRIMEDAFLIKEEIATIVYSVAQEALMNIRHHSDASYVMVKISGNSSAFNMFIQDNGRGIRPEELADSRSFGIIGMKERIAGVNGKISIKGVPGKGTSVLIKVPIRT